MQLMLVAFGFFFFMGAAVGAAPVPPCSGPAAPAASGVGEAPNVAVWLPEELPAGWTLPACVGWGPAVDPVLIAVAGRLRASDGVIGLIDRLRRVSALREVRYWSVMRNAWRPIYDKVNAVTGPDGDTPRQDFAADELQPGSTLYFIEDRTDPLGEMVQQLVVRERSATRLVAELSNVTAATFALMTVVPVGGARTILTLDRESDDIWRYYTLTRIIDEAPGIFDPPRDSYANRATAMFGWFAGAPAETPR